MRNRRQKTESAPAKAASTTPAQPAANEPDEADLSPHDEYVNALIAEADLTELEAHHARIAVSDGVAIEDVITATIAARDAAADLTFEIEEVDDPEFVNLYGGAFKAVCVDGWESEVRTTPERAAASAEEHRGEIRAAAFAEQVG